MFVCSLSFKIYFHLFLDSFIYVCNVLLLYTPPSTSISFQHPVLYFCAGLMLCQFKPFPLQLAFGHGITLTKTMSSLFLIIFIMNQISLTICICKQATHENMQNLPGSSTLNKTFFSLEHFNCQQLGVGPCEPCPTHAGMLTSLILHKFFRCSTCYELRCTMALLVNRNHNFVVVLKHLTLTIFLPPLPLCSPSFEGEDEIQLSH